MLIFCYLGKILQLFLRNLVKNVSELPTVFLEPEGYLQRLFSIFAMCLEGTKAWREVIRSMFRGYPQRLWWVRKIGIFCPLEYFSQFFFHIAVMGWILAGGSRISEKFPLCVLKPLLCVLKKRNVYRKGQTFAESTKDEFLLGGGRIWRV